MKKLALGLMSILAVLTIFFGNDKSNIPIDGVQRSSILAGHGDY
jgi:hypothetical protein